MVKVNLLNVGTPTVNNRIYPKTVVEKALDSLVIKEMLVNNCFFVYDDYRNIGDMSHIVALCNNLALEDNSVVTGEINTIDTPYGRSLREAIENNKVAFTLCGVGTINCNEKHECIVSEYEIQGVTLIRNEEKA